MSNNITQIFISETNEDLSLDIKKLTSSIKYHFPEEEYKLFNNSMIEDFLQKHYEPIVLSTYRKLNPFAYKSDFARYCILNKLGGWYFDIGMRCVSHFSINESRKLVFFRDMNIYTKTSWACANGIIYSIKGHPVLRRAIDLIIENAVNEYYGLTPLCPTGPSLWGKAIAEIGIDSTAIVGDFIELTPYHPNKNKAAVLPDGEIFAYNKPCEGGDLTSLNCLGTNNYNDFWHSNSVYNHV